MPLFVNPFRKHDGVEFPDVLVSLQTTPRHSSVSQSSDDPEKTVNRPDVGDESRAVDRLRAEIDLDVAASGHDSVYDRTYRTACTDTAILCFGSVEISGCVPVDQPTLPYSTVETAC